MFATLRISAIAVAIVTAQPMMASHTAPEESAEDSAPPAAAERAPDPAAIMPAVSAPAALSSSLLHVMAASVARFSVARQTMQSFAEDSVQRLPNSSPLDQIQIVAAMRRRAGERWNTTDSSRPSDFALCYRFSRMMGLQVIPGDLTPSKLPTPKMLSVKNQGSGMGVLVGMTFRLGRMAK